uniref:BUB1 N-terminal domain-containing protein n=1 Tax=Kalanchoe fedtschenkoi TaxID=63787 RepID=A0A7N0US08_KALFE
MGDGGGAATAILDPETQFLYSKQQTGNEWELFKENVRPLKRGRNVQMLNTALKLNTDTHIKKSLLEKRRELIKAIDEYEGDDPLHPWIQCIKWVQESFPPGGDSSGLIVLYEQCVRKFWHDDRYKNDHHYLKIWLEYAESCADAEVIYNFLDANEIGLAHADFYISYALHMETKNKYKRANDIFNLGLARDAKPKEKLETAYKKFFGRSMRRPQNTEEESSESDLPVRSFGTVLTREENRRLNMQDPDHGVKKLKSNGAHATPLAVYKDPRANTAMGHLHNIPKTSKAPWQSLGTLSERNKENNAIPSKWTSHKIPQKPVSRTGAAAGQHIEVFVDEECVDVHKKANHGAKSSALQLREGDGVDVKKETELLREHPLRNFPLSSLPR